MASDIGWFKKGYGALKDEETGLAPTPAIPVRTRTMADRSDALKSFLAKIGRIRQEMEDVKGKFKDLGNTYEDSFGAATPEQIKTFKADLEAAMNEIKGATQRLHNNVKSLQQEINDAETDKSLLRIKKTETGKLEAELKQFRDSVYAFQTRMKDDRTKDYRNKLRAFLNREPSNEEVDKWVESGDDSGLYQSLLHDQARPAVQKVLNDIQERHRAAKALQTSIEELHKLFQDMQNLVHEQGDQIESLTKRLDKAGDYTSSALNAINTAAKIKTKTERSKLMIIIVVAVLIAVVVAVVLGTVFGIRPVK